MINQDTVCAIATAQGGAIGIIRVSGPRAIEITSHLFIPVQGKPLTERKPYTLTFGKILSPQGEVIDEVLVSLFRAPHSYTGEDRNHVSWFILYFTTSNTTPHPERMPIRIAW